MDSLRFGDADAEDTARVMPGIVAGVGGYGNCMGLPNIGGEVGFDPSYAGNPLVNALCIGVLPAARLQTSAATGAGNAVVLLGAKTGRDGIGGVSVLASATFDETGAPARRPSVQVGDPFTEKIVTECVLELYERELVIGVQDLGGAGLSCAVSETAAKAGTGMDVDLDRVPLREPSMAPEEVLVSESQERMLAIVAPEQADRRARSRCAVGRARLRHRHRHRYRPARHPLARRRRSSTCRRGHSPTTAPSTPARSAARRRARRRAGAAAGRCAGRRCCFA